MKFDLSANCCISFDTANGRSAPPHTLPIILYAFWFPAKLQLPARLQHV